MWHSFPCVYLFEKLITSFNTHFDISERTNIPRHADIFSRGLFYKSTRFKVIFPSVSFVFFFLEISTFPSRVALVTGPFWDTFFQPDTFSMTNLSSDLLQHATYRIFNPKLRYMQSYYYYYYWYFCFCLRNMMYEILVDACVMCLYFGIFEYCSYKIYLRGILKSKYGQCPSRTSCIFYFRCIIGSSSELCSWKLNGKQVHQ